MPFKKVGDNDYTSPSGRHFNGAQVRLYYAGGGKFPGEKKANGGPVMANSYDDDYEAKWKKMQGDLDAIDYTPKSPDMRNTVYKNGGPVHSNNEVRYSNPKGYQGMSIGMAAGGPVLGRSRSFAKPDGKADEFTGGREPPKMSAPAAQEYGSKGAPAKRTGDKSEPAVKPRT